MVARAALGALTLLVAVVGLACKRGASVPPDGADTTSTSGPAEEDGGGEATDEGEALTAIEQPTTSYAGRELPTALHGELHDETGRIVMLEAGIVASAACVDCGAPSYLMFLAVRCSDELTCEVLTEQCQGSIHRSERAFTLAFTPIEGVDAKVCEPYSGSFLAK